jgi:phosphatidylinositol alpha-1,6-mannosyltransferase
MDEKAAGNVLVFSPDYKPSSGGVGEHAFRIARAMKRRGLAVSVLAPRLPGGAEFDRQSGLETRRVRQVPLLTPLLYLFALISIVKKRRVGFVYCVTSHPSGILCAAARIFAEFRYSVTVHGHEVMYARRGLRQTVKSALRPLQVAFMNAADRVFPVSAFTRDSAVRAGVRGEKTHIIYNGIDPGDFGEPADVGFLLKRQGAEGRKIVLSVGRLVERKGHDTVIRAMPGVLERVPDAAYVIVGGGPESDRLARLAEDTGVARHVHLLGRLPRAETVGLMNRCDVLVMPSRRVGTSVEGFGIVFLEAGALGRPVVGGRSGGIPDAIEDGVTGLLVDPEDTAALADAIATILLDPDLARRMGEAGRERVERLFTWDRVAERILESLETV